MIQPGGLNSQFRSQQVAWVLCRLGGDRAVARSLRVLEAAETTFTACQVVPEPRSLRRQLRCAPVQAARELVAPQGGRNIRETIIGVGNPGLELQRPADN